MHKDEYPEPSNPVDFHELLKAYGAEVVWSNLHWENDDNPRTCEEDVAWIKFPNGMSIDIGSYRTDGYTVELIRREEDWYELRYENPYLVTVYTVKNAVAKVLEFAKAQEGMVWGQVSDAQR